MQRLRLCAAISATLAALLHAQTGAAAEPIPKLAHVHRQDLKRVPAHAGRSGFVYAPFRQLGRVGLVLDRSRKLQDLGPNDLDLEQSELLLCGAAAAVEPGYREACAAARENEAGAWTRADQTGHAIWYSRDLDGALRCYSLDGADCLPTDVAAPADAYKPVDGDVRSAMVSAERAKAFYAQHRTVALHSTEDNHLQFLQLPDDADEGVRVYVRNDATSETWALDSQSVRQKTLRQGDRGAWMFAGGRWVDLADGFDPNASANRFAGKPLGCAATELPLPAAPSAAPPGSVSIREPQETEPAAIPSLPAPWCQQLRSVEVRLRQRSAQSLYERKIAHMDDLFDQYEDWAVANVEETGRYRSRIAELRDRRQQKLDDSEYACALAFLPPAAAACIALRTEAGDLLDELNALSQEADAKRESAKASVAQRRAQDWHRLHETWADTDATRFAALLRVESKELDELKQLKDAYDRTAEQQHEAYLKAVAQYEHDASALGVAEHLPLIGAEIKHIEDYANDPSDRNLRRMLLGAFGPAGEQVEGVLELTVDGGGLDAGKTRFLTDVLGDMASNQDFASALEAVVADAIRDLGDEAIEGAREIGMWTDRPGGGVPLTLPYANLAELRLKTQPVAYDPWLDDADPEVGNFQRAFTAAKQAYESYMGNYASYDPDSTAQIENAAGAASFGHGLEAVFVHSMGADYDAQIRKNPKYANWTRAQIDQELWKVVADPAYAEQRRARWVDSSVLGGRPAGLLSDGDHAIIVLNSDLLSRDRTDLGKFYLEELGHLLNWWRCELFDIDPNRCAVMGDGGARFRDAVMLDPSLYDEPLETLLARLPAHEADDRTIVALQGGKSARLEGWPDRYTANDHIAGDGKISFLMRAGLDIGSEYPGVSDEFDIEAVISLPTPGMAGDPWKKSDKGYCSYAANASAQTVADCNVPTMWVAISFRDAIKFSVAKAPVVKDSKFAQSGVDLSPRIVRKHGGKLAFQPVPGGSADQWRLMPEHTIYYKEFSIAAEAKLDLAKAGQAVSGRHLPKPHSLEAAGKGQAEGSYMVEIPVHDKELFGLWLGLDVGSALAGCVGGFVFAAFAEEDPVTLCHAGSDLAEGLETALQQTDKRITSFLEADASVALPLSVEYKAALGGKAKPVAAPQTAASRVWHTDQAARGSDVAALYEAPPPRPNAIAPTAASSAAAEGVKAKFGSALSKLGNKSVQPLLVFRPRVSWDLTERLVNRGKYDLPSTIVSE